MFSCLKNKESGMIHTNLEDNELIFINIYKNKVVSSVPVLLGQIPPQILHELHLQPIWQRQPTKIIQLISYIEAFVKHIEDPSDVSCFD